MKTSGLRSSLSPPGFLSRILRLICLSSCFLLAGDPAVADIAGPSSTRGVYVPAPNVQVPDLRQRLLSEAQKIATDARLRLQVSGEAPADPSKVVIADQKPEPNTMVPAGTTVSVVVRAPASRQMGPAREIIVPERLTVVPELLKRSLSEAQPLITSARLRLEVSGGAPEDTSHAIVVEQKPPPGTRVRVGSTVMVTVQIQRPEDGAIVPDVQRQPLLEARRRVNKARLRLEVAGGWPAEPLLAMIVDQKPGPDTRVPLNSIVVVVVRNLPGPPQTASPPAPPQPPIVSPPLRVSPPQIVMPPEVPPREEWVLVPALRQRPLMDALQRVRNARLRLEVTGGWPADPGRAAVVEQTPAQDTRVRIGTSVTVQVLPSGQALQPTPPPTQPVPTQPTPPQPAQPRPPASLPPAPPPRVELVVVPELRQQLLPGARDLANSAGLQLRVRGLSPADETRTVVVTQSPAAGTRVAARYIVLVELGAALLVVPELRKHPLDEARKILDEAGFGLALMGGPPSNESGAQVVEQAPLPGARAAAGSTVTVRVKVSRITTWVIAVAGALLAAGAALGVARWRGVRSQLPRGSPAFASSPTGMSGHRRSSRTGRPRRDSTSGCAAVPMAASRRWRRMLGSSRRIGEPMAESALTLRDFLLARTEDARQAIERSDAGAKLKEAVGKLPGIAWGPVAKEIEAKIAEVLDVDIVGILLGGWKKYRQLQRYRDHTKYPPEETILLSLTEHSISSLHHPKIEILAEQVLLARLEFTITLALKLEGIVLKVRDGKIREICAGRCRGKGTLECAGVPLLEKETERFELPGRIDLGDGIEIPAP